MEGQYWYTNITGSCRWSRNRSYGPQIYNVNSLCIASANPNSILETQFNIGLCDQNCNITINGPCNQPRNFDLLKIISSIYFNGKTYNYGPYIKLLHTGTTKLNL